MTTSELNRAVARATGEPINLIEVMGFSLLIEEEIPCENDVPGQMTPGSGKPWPT